MKHIINCFSFGVFVLVVIGSFSSCQDLESEKDKTLFWVMPYDTLQFSDGVVDLQQVIPKVLRGADGKGIDFIAWVQNNQIYVNTNIYDTVGNVIGIMHRNQWVTNPDFILDRNFDQNAIEVKNNTGEIIFQIQIVANYIQMRGKFDRKNAHSIIFVSEVNKKGNTRTNIKSGWPRMLKRLDSIDNSMKFPPIFKYPSHDYMGHRAG